ncbi:MAG: hypothetical protein A2V86_01765 [Deltaproteobacteria bacterium RBG_16_49_23]|nr:MAG: hypothetical protein A2V86_01765 [Deltaproteobacteria bacterium RBG_16_49_23]
MIEKQVMELMKNLDTLDERSRMELLSQVDQQRQELLLILLKHLDTSSSINVKAATIYLMGRHRLSEGIEELIRRIDFDAGENLLLSALPLWDRYPAMEALINIGQPAVSAAIELLATDMNDLRRDLAVKVVRYVEDGEVAGFILTRAHAAETDPNRKANLQDAINRLAKLPK